jgi:hypothetical protein
MAGNILTDFYFIGVFIRTRTTIFSINLINVNEIIFSIEIVNARTRI